MKKICIQLLCFIPGILFSQTVSLPISQQTADPRTNTQVKLSSNAVEKLWQTKEAVWEEDMQKELQVNKLDFKLFLSDNTLSFIKDKRRFLIGAFNGSINANNMGVFFDDLKKKFISIYQTPSPSSKLAERNKSVPVVQATCNPSCDNIGFQDSTLNAWSAFYAINNSPNFAGNNFFIQNVTGGAAGLVTKAGGPDPLLTQGTLNTYQVNLITASGGLDPIAGALIPTKPPLGGFSAMIGDGTNPGQGVGELEQTFSVSTSNPILTIQYAVVLENPTSHTYYEQPFFNMVVLDAVTKDTISNGCGNYSVVSGPGLAGYKAIYYPLNGDTVYCRPWTTVFVPLYAYVGKCVTVKFVAADCSLGAHFGYAYVAASCSQLNVNTSSPNFCTGQKLITLTASPGASAYSWSGPCVSGSTTQQSLTATCAGTYQLIETSSAGPTCIDTINTIVQPSLNGPPPIPSFTATQACFGTATQFTNTSNPGPGVGITYYWDFYNTGQINDSVDANPVFNYPQPGTYQVVMHETANGCGADTLVSVKVDSIPTLFQTPTVTPGAAKLCRCNGKVSILVAIDGSYHYVTTSFNNDTIFAGGGPLGLSTSNLFDNVAFSNNFDSMTVTYSGLCPGNYDFYVNCPHPFPVTLCSAGESGKTDTIPFTLNGAVISTAVGIAIDPATCNKSNGSATVTATGVVTGLTYHWNTGATQDTLVALASGTYSVTVTNSGGCTKTATVTVKDSSIISSTLQLVSPKCFNGNNGSATITPTAGTAPYSYVWSTGVTASGGTGSSSTDTNLGQGSYFVTVTDASGCSESSAVTITQPPILTVTTQTSQTGCATPDGIATVSPNGGTPGLTVDWSNGLSSTSIGGLAAGSYAVTVTDANGCSTVSSVLITKRQPPVVSIKSNLTSYCLVGGDSVCVLFTRLKPASFAFVSEVWHFGTGDTSSASSPVYCYKKTGDYTVSLSCTDSAGCVGDTTIPGMISINSQPYVNFVYNPYPAQAGLPVNFENQSTIATNFAWYFADPKSGKEDSAFTTNASHTFQDTGLYCMTLTGSTGFCSQVSNPCIHVVHTLCTLSDSIPNVFTPNNDNINDDFIVKSNGMQSVTCEIFDRWGIKVTDFNGLTSNWNGKLGGGSPAPEGTYFYTVSGTCINDSKKVAHGFVQLLR